MKLTEEEFKKETEASAIINNPNEDGYTDYQIRGVESAVFRHDPRPLSETYTVMLPKPKEVQCVPCGVKFKTEKYDKCPMCSTPWQRISENERRADQEFQQFKDSLDKQAEKILQAKHQQTLYKYNLITEDIYQLESKEVGKLESPQS
jgi:hypothetical protein